ncbi:fatty acid desaturase [Paraliomyxa miuraensis]|uniref:fatty acid desaturase n=1 Tax=Paraliomyxa miuraensis TaxID=376150 RepID=UPI00224E2783|nr:fatty acid desaturase [Paraliomyxa miuraensis]MCX4247187.1 fatty acid desaturase [Paraliomyxa miuraensis]
MAAIYASLGIAMAGWASVELLAPVIVVCYLRGALLTHELMHVRRPEQVVWPLRMMMLFETPLGLGYREHQDIHLRHHRRTATADDPELFQIRGGSVRAFGAAMLGPELAAAGWVLGQGIGASLRREATVRALTMLSLVAIAPAVFFSYWLVLRLTVGTSNFVFHHVLHYRRGVRAGGRGDERDEDARYGTFSLRLPRPLDAALRLVLGPDLAAVLCEHDAHHAWPRVKADLLPGLLSAFPASPVVRATNTEDRR